MVSGGQTPWACGSMMVVAGTLLGGLVCDARHRCPNPQRGGGGGGNVLVTL